MELDNVTFVIVVTVVFKAETNKKKYVKCYKCNKVGHTKLQCNKKTACSICKKDNHVEENCYFRIKKYCSICRKNNHVEKDCRFKTKAASFLAEENVSNVKDRVVVIVGSGCTNHMSNDKDILTDMIPCLENMKLTKNDKSMVTECWVNQFRKL
jgi:hypothetical protein